MYMYGFYKVLTEIQLQILVNYLPITHQLLVTPNHTPQVITRNLDRIIDINYYPIPEAKLSNTRHRPIGIGVQGLADAFILMRYPFESDEAQLLNRQIFETIYYAALTSSCEIASVKGSYQTYQGSPVSNGVRKAMVLPRPLITTPLLSLQVLQYDMWGVTPTDLWDWSSLKEKIAEYGMMFLFNAQSCS